VALVLARLPRPYLMQERELLALPPQQQHTAHKRLFQVGRGRVGQGGALAGRQSWGVQAACGCTVCRDTCGQCHCGSLGVQPKLQHNRRL